jgi:hypothetical protein
MTTTIKTFLRDGWSGDLNPVPCVIEHGDNAILIRPEGTGDCGSAEGYGWPVVIEYYEKDVRVLVWADINQQDPTHVISLAGAREAVRKE